MKKLIIAISLLLIYTGVVQAAPNIVSDDFTSSMVDDCIVVLDGVTTKVVPMPTMAGKARCVFDVGFVSNGAHTISLATENMWGVSDPIPFDFTKELPPNLLNIRLEE